VLDPDFSTSEEARMLRLKLTTALVIATAVWPSGAYAITDPYSPVVPTAVPDAAASAPQDLRSPDARDAALAAEAPPQDLRSPDARDAARETEPIRAEGTGVSARRSAPSVPDSFEWGDAGIGAAVLLALLSLASGTALLVGRSRQRTPTT
jgi:hypothetical protein